MTTSDIANVVALLRRIHLMSCLDFADLPTAIQIQGEAFRVSMPLREELLKHEIKIENTACGTSQC